MKHSLTNILIKPIVTEKSTAISKNNKCTFLVSDYATKDLIRDAFKEIFPGRKVLSVKTLKVMGHKRRTKTGFASPKDKKKAVITFSGDRIEYFPEAS